MRGELLGKGADVIFTTCDVDFATPVVQEAINRGMLAVAPCIGTDQMGPKRFGAKGQLAFSFGNVAQDEGSAMAEYAWKQGWKTAALAHQHAARLLQERRAGVRGALHAARRQDRRRGDATRLGANNVQNAVTPAERRERRRDRHRRRAFGELPALVAGLRSLGNDTPILNSWAGDGTYWVPKDPAVTNYYFVTFASAFGDDPSKAVNALAKAVKAGTGGFVTGAAAIDGVVTAIKRAAGSTQRRRPRGADGEVQEGADALGPRELLAAAPHACSAASTA